MEGERTGKGQRWKQTKKYETEEASEKSETEVGRDREREQDQKQGELLDKESVKSQTVNK